MHGYPERISRPRPDDTVTSQPTAPPWDLVAEQIPHIVWVTDAQGYLKYLNRRGYDLVGLTPEEMSGPGWLRVVHPDDAATARDAWEGALREGTTYQVEYRIGTIAGDYLWMVVRAAPLRGSDGQILGWAGTWTDVDDLKRLQDQLGGARCPPAASLAVLEALQATTPLGIGFVDRDLRIMHMNEVLAGLNGFSSEEVEGRMLAEVSTIWHQVEPVYQQVLETGEACRQREGRAADCRRPAISLASQFLAGAGQLLAGAGGDRDDRGRHGGDRGHRAPA